mgnify:CR=1 FL=1
MKGSPSSTPRIAKWRLGLEGYNFRIEFVQGCKNVIADYLSRSPIPGEPEAETLDIPIMTVENSALSPSEWSEGMNQDGVLERVKDRVLNGWPVRCKDLDEDLRDFREVRFELNLQGDKVLRNNRLIPPECLSSKICGLAHEGHLGRSFTKK